MKTEDKETILFGMFIVCAFLAGLILITKAGV